MRINNVTLMPAAKQNTKSNVNFGINIKYDEVIKTGEGAVKATKELGKKITSVIPKEEKQSGLMNVFEWVAKKIAKILPKKSDDSTLEYVVVLGNSAKELMGTMIYTVQALTNEDLAPDKRKFVGMYDLGVGIASTSLGLVAGLAMVKGQGKLIKALIGGEKASHLPGYTKALQGLAFIIPVILQNILIKRIIAPAVATPVAGKLKKQLEDKEAAQKGIKAAQDEPLPLTKDGFIDLKAKLAETDKAAENKK